jgi:hypothetical protein
VAEIDALLAAGSSVRSVARMYHLARTSLGRHARHVAPAGRPVLVPGPPPEVPRVDPLQAALQLFEQAKTSRQQLRSAEAVRAATRLALKSVDQLDAEHLERLDSNVATAEALFRSSPNYEEQLRSLAGLREAVRQRIDAIRAGDVIVVIPTFAFCAYRDDVSMGPPVVQSECAPFRLSAATYWAGVPAQFRDLGRYTAERSIDLAWIPEEGRQHVKVRELATGAVVWSATLPALA